MYANLLVRYRNSKGQEREVPAWEVEREANILVIRLDDPEDEGSYAAPAGERRISPDNLLSVKASW